MKFRRLQKYKQLLKGRVLLTTTQQQPQDYLGERASGEVVVLYKGGGRGAMLRPFMRPARVPESPPLFSSHLHHDHSKVSAIAPAIASQSQLSQPDRWFTTAIALVYRRGLLPPPVRATPAP